MRHQNKKKTLGREFGARRALLRSLADSLCLHGGLTTTLAKARLLRQFVEPLVTKARRGTLAERRNLLKVLYTEAAVNNLFTDIAPRYTDRPGGYLRIIKLGSRGSDAAETARIEFV